MRKKVLLIQPIHEAGFRILQERFEVQVASDPSEETVVREVGEASGLIFRQYPVTRRIIAAGGNLEVIGRHGVGLDNIDLSAATARGIVVLNTPDANTRSVAEHTLLAIGALAKRIAFMDKAVRQGQWMVRDQFSAVDLEGKILGIIGLGRIGSLVAKKAMAAFDMRVVAFDPALPPNCPTIPPGVERRESMAKVLREADFVSLHVPLTPATNGLIGAAQLKMMKPAAFLVNFARGEVVDGAALYDALKEHSIAGAALDVYAPEPPEPDNALFSLDNVLLSPHSSALTIEGAIRMAVGVAEGVVDALEGRRPRFVVNPEVYAGR